MIVSPELISASSAPSARPLKSWETKFGQLIMKNDHGRSSRTNRQIGEKSGAAGDGSACGAGGAFRSRISAEIAAEGVRFLHLGCTGHDLDDLPIVFLVLH